MNFLECMKKIKNNLILRSVTMFGSFMLVIQRLITFVLNVKKRKKKIDNLYTKKLLETFDQFPNSTIAQLLKPLPHKLWVKFAYYCANDVRHLLKDQRSIDALDVVDRWLRDEATDEEVRIANIDAYTIAFAAANADDYVAYAAAYAVAYTTYCINITNVMFAATSASNAVYDAKDKKLEEYRQYLIKMIDELSELEKLMYFKT